MKTNREINQVLLGMGKRTVLCPLPLAGIVRLVILTLQTSFNNGKCYSKCLIGQSFSQDSQSHHAISGNFTSSHDYSYFMAQSATVILDSAMTSSLIAILCCKNAGIYFSFYVGKNPI